MFDPSSAALHEGIYGLPSTPEQAAVVLIPVPWEATVSYGSGTAGGSDDTPTTATEDPAS